MTAEQRSLHAKLSDILDAVGYIPKNGTAPPAMGSFKFARSVDVADVVRKEFAKRKLTMVPTNVELLESLTYQTKGGATQFLVSVRVRWLVSDGESGESVEVESAGSGADSADKAIPKALTNAQKYALLLAFHIPTGDDPEAHAPDEAAGKPTTTPAQPAAAAAPAGGKPDIDELDW